MRSPVRRDESVWARSWQRHGMNGIQPFMKLSRVHAFEFKSIRDSNPFAVVGVSLESLEAQVDTLEESIRFLQSTPNPTRLCADWLRPLVPEVPVQFIAASEPFWRTRR